MIPLPRHLVLLSLLWAASAAAAGLGFPEGPARVGFAVPSPLVVELQSGSGAAETVASSTSVTLTSGSATGQFSTSDMVSASWSSTLNVTIPAGTSRGPTVFYRDVTPGPVTLTAAAAGRDDGKLPLTVLSVGFSDDLESGTLFDTDNPRGKWHFWGGTASVTASNSTAAAHRGARGLRINDQDASTGSGEQRHLTVDIAPARGSIYARAWVRVNSASTAGVFNVLNIAVTENSNNHAAAQVQMPQLEVATTGGNASGGFPTDGSTTRLTAGQWHLVELGAIGVGTSNGTRAVWIDGVLAASRPGQDWSPSSWRASRFSFGETWSPDRRFTGTIDQDDYRISAAPPANTLTVTLPPQIGTECMPFQVGLINAAAAAPAQAPYDVQVALSVTAGTASFFSDDACTVASTTATLPWGDSAATHHVRASAEGALTVRAEQIDFFGAEVGTQVVPGLVLLPDGGVATDGGESIDAPRSFYALSCATAAAPPAVWALGALALIARFVRRRSRAR